METIVIVALIGLTLTGLAQTYLIYHLNILYKSKDLGEYITMTANPKKGPEPDQPNEVEVERYS